MVDADPKGYFSFSEIANFVDELLNEDEIKISLENLERLRLIVSGETAHHRGGVPMGVISGPKKKNTKFVVTDLGSQLKNICDVKSL